ncbi:MAG: hypothetical protein LT070_00190 [Solirubrobacteraceae bacterium]|nr:hypothetical protein [Solirubrobacteraceae bacterium]
MSAVAPDLDAPRPANGERFSDALTVTFGDAAASLFGTIRLGLAGGDTASGMAILFHRGEVLTVSAEGGIEAVDPSRWEGISAAGIDAETIEPLRAWRLHFAGEEIGLDLELEATGPACALDARDPVARAGGMLGFEQPLLARGVADVNGQRLKVSALGQRGRSWGDPDWSRITRTRTAGVWLADRTLTLSAIARTGDEGHGREAISAAILGVDDCAKIADPRISTTFDADGRQRRAALELWPDDEKPPIRAEGEVLCGTTLDLGRLRLDCAFVSWRVDGQRCVGRYDVLRREPAVDGAE